ncbi:MAG: hypothetical protein JXR37_29020 [Kiritimatiellae bacterium]|nr:hypothetical protein [Kiritimatiellia bacterium]
MNRKRVVRYVRGLTVLLVGLHGAAEAIPPTFPGATWQAKTPGEIGLDATKLDQFASNVGGVGCIVRHGYMVKTWGTQTSKADWASAMKPVMSTMLMFAVKEGKLASVDALVRPYVQSVLGQDLITKDRTMTFRHLANMVSGYALPEAPGAAWAYNDYGINLYSKMLFDGVYGQTPDTAALNANRLGALQFQDGSIFSSRSGYGLSTTPRDFARIGLFWLNKGNWNGTQLLAQSYFDNHMKPGVPKSLPRTAGGNNDYLNVYFTGGGTDQSQSGPGFYGFNWWFNAEVGTTGKTPWPDAPADMVMANGHWNKELMVIYPGLGIIAAARGNWGTLDPGNASASMNQNLKLLVEAVTPGVALPGQLMVDPNSKRWLVRNRDRDGDGKPDPFFLCGPGDPEGFLYRGTRNADGTRAGDQMALIDKVTGTGANGIYLMAVRSHGGDGGSTENPFVNSDPAQGFDPDILDQWETWFTAMADNGIVVYFFFYDDGARIWNTGDSVGADERTFIQTLVNRYEHHANLIWCVAEEYQERYTAARVSNIAAEIRAADDHGHVIAVHKLSGLSFAEFADDPNLAQFAIQYNQSTASALHAGMLTAWSNAAGKYNLNMSEAAGHGTGATARQKNWACAMGGAYVMILGMDIASTSVSDLLDCGRQVEFFEGTTFNVMAPHDELAHGGTEYVLALPGQCYIAYAAALAGSIGLKSMTAGPYDFTWFDVTNGNTVNQYNVPVSAGDRTWSRPAGIGNELAVYVRRTSGGGNVRPTANAQSVTVQKDMPKDIMLTYSDPDGPGPFSFSISSGPSHGSLSGTGSTRTYAPATGYTGADSFAFTVSDGLTSSAPAAVSITVQAAANGAPVASDGAFATAAGTPVYTPLAYTDSDGPGPYTITIVTPPAGGTLSGTGNDRTYTPAAGFTGTDSFTWKVNDGLADSNVATVRITVSGEGAIRIEAEAMDLSTYRTEAGAGYASGGVFISLKGGASPETGTASTNFPGASGPYDVVVAYFDENDGAAHLKLRIAGALADEWDLALDLGDSGASADTLVRRSVAHALQIAGGAAVQIEGTETSLEHARVDYVEFIPVAAVSTNALQIRVASGADDVEQRPDGTLYMDSSDLELTEGESGLQTIGLRFGGVNIRNGASIRTAYVQFKVDETSAEGAVLTIHGEDSDDARAFKGVACELDARVTTRASVAWSPAAWDAVGAAGAAQRTPDLSPVVQEVVNRPGWLSGNALVLLITGTGLRVAEAYEGDPSGAPLLHVEFSGATGDSDGDGLSDGWEVAVFGTTNAPSGSANGDFDGDGVSNIAEFIAGTDAAAGGRSYFAVAVGQSNGQVLVTFPTIPVSGTGYAGYSRHYALQRTADPADEPSWAPPAGYADIAGAGQTVTFLDGGGGTQTYYRGLVWLEN